MVQRWSFLGAATLALILIGISIFWYSRSVASADETFRLGEFGVELTLSRSLAQEIIRTSREQEGVGDVVHITSSAFANDDNECSLGVFYKIDKDNIAASKTTWTEERLDAWKTPQGSEPARVKEFTDFYLIFEPSDISCAYTPRENEGELSAKRSLAESLTTARYIQY